MGWSHKQQAETIRPRCIEGVPQSLAIKRCSDSNPSPEQNQIGDGSLAFCWGRQTVNIGCRANGCCAQAIYTQSQDRSGPVVRNHPPPAIVELRNLLCSEQESCSPKSARAQTAVHFGFLKTLSTSPRIGLEPASLRWPFTQRFSLDNIYAQ